MSERQRFSRAELFRLLTATGDVQQELFRQARAVRRAEVGDEVVLRGVIEISSYCQKHCDYCSMRATNKKSERYRITAEQIMEIVGEMQSFPISTTFFQAGQDPHIDALLEAVIPAIKYDLGMNVLLCLGERPRHVYQRYAELGADSYILKFEIADPQLYRDVIHAEPGRRFQCLGWIKDAGMKLGTGNIVGLPGQTVEHLVDDLEFACALDPDFVSSAPFIPNENTPFENASYGDVNVTLNTMALWRIMLGNPLIPTVSALEKIEVGGQLRGLNAGANVITINFTPEFWREKYGIYSRDRFVVSANHAFDLIDRAGLQVRSPNGATTAPPSAWKAMASARCEGRARAASRLELPVVTEPFPIPRLNGKPTNPSECAVAGLLAEPSVET
jgi:biotin synthase